MTDSGEWRFFHDEYDQFLAERTPPFADEFRAPFRDLLQEVGASFVGLAHFLDGWRRFRAHDDPSQEFNGDSLTMAIEGDQVHFYPHYDQWGDGVEIWAPLDLVEELIEAYRQWMTRQH